MAALIDAKTVGAGFPNEGKIVRVTYDFAADGGAIADYDVLTAENDCVVMHLWTMSKASITSSDAVVMDLGKGAGGTEFHSDVVKGNLETDESIVGAGKIVELTAGEKIVFGVEAYAITAGKLEFVFQVFKK
jgi:hypothetical protein